MAMEPSITPMAQTPKPEWIDTVDVSIELPMGPKGLRGDSGVGWTVGDGDPINPPTEPEGSIYLNLDTGEIWQVIRGLWSNTGASMMGPQGTLEAHVHKDYLPLTAGDKNPLSGKLHSSSGADFTGPVNAATPSAVSAGPNEVITVGYLDNLNLRRFFGTAGTGQAISTGYDWNAATEQGIYQQTGTAGTPPAGNNAPPGTTGRTIGLVQRIDQTTLTQMVYDIDRRLLFTRSLILGLWGDWRSLTNITSFDAPNASGSAGAYGSDWAHGQVWVQVEAFKGN